MYRPQEQKQKQKMRIVTVGEVDFVQTFFFNYGGHQSTFGLAVKYDLSFKARVEPSHMCTMDSSNSPLVRHLLTS